MGFVRIRIPAWLSRMGLVATIEGCPVPVDVPIPVAQTRANVRFLFTFDGPDTAIRGEVRCTVPVVKGRETAVGIG